MAITRPNRRTVLKALSTGTVVGLAGCAGQSENEPGRQEQTETETTPPGEEETTQEQQDETIPNENVIYAFAPGQIAVIDPQSTEVVAEITEGLDDVDWGDALPSPDNRRLFVNDGTNAQVLVIDTQQQRIETRIDVGPNPVHAYQPRETELWTHSDEEGAFYIINVNELAVTDRVVAAQDDTGHGKLAYHEQLGTAGYATNTNDPGIHVVDLEAKETTGFIETHDEGGTHAKRYNPVSNRVYVEGTQDARTAVVNPDNGTVETHYDIVGHIYNTPGDEYVVWVNEEQGVNVLDAEREEFVAEIPVEGGPDKIFFHEQGGTVYGFTANTQNAKTAVVDFDQMAVVKEIEAGDIIRPEDAQFLHRGGLTADGWFVTPASGDGVVSIIDANALELHEQVPVTEGVDGVAYIGSFE